MPKVKITRTDRILQRKLTRMARRYAVSPLDLRELQLGETIEVCEKAAQLMAAAGLVKIVGERASGRKVNAITMMDTTQSTIVDEETLTPETEEVTTVDDEESEEV